MDPRALGEALLAVGMTPAISVGMALIVVSAIVVLSKRIFRR